MRYVEHETALSRPDKDGVTLRDLYTEKARQGNTAFRDLLDGPDYPLDLAYLDHWSRTLTGRSGATQYGLAPLSFTTLRDWSLLMDVQPSPQEVEALLILDGLRIASPKEEKEERTEDAGHGGTPVAKVAPWPQSKPQEVS